MPTPTDGDIDNAIREAAVAPKRAANETGSVEAHSLHDLIEFDRYINGKDAAGASARRGLRFTKLIPPGSV